MLAEAAPPRDIADALAELKAQRLAAPLPDRLVLGADQVLVCDGRLYDKPQDLAEARAQLLALRGRRHELLSAAVVFEAARPVWRHIGRAQPHHAAVQRRLPRRLSRGGGPGRARHRRRLPARGPRRPALRPASTATSSPSWACRSSRSSAFCAPAGFASNDRGPALAAVIGWPIAHSRSPMLHGHWLAATASPATTSRSRCRPNASPRVPVAARGSASAATNVTIPHKEAALALATEASPTWPRAIGAANTLTFREDGTIHADNTDGYGFIANLRQHAPDWAAAAGPSLVLGAGGSARAIVEALLAEGAPEVRIANRTRSRAEALRDHFGRADRVVDWPEATAAAVDAATIVNTTSLGMSRGEPTAARPRQASDRPSSPTSSMAPRPTPFVAEARRLRPDGRRRPRHAAPPGRAGLRALVRRAPGGRRRRSGPPSLA